MSKLSMSLTKRNTSLPVHSNISFIIFCALLGVLLRKLQSPGYLSTVSHIILDEVHERGVRKQLLFC